MRRHIGGRKAVLGLMALAAAMAAGCMRVAPNEQNQQPPVGPWGANRTSTAREAMTLISNQENTAFEVREAGGAWRHVGKGKILEARVPAAGPFDVRATPDGYRPRTLALAQPVRELRFTFEVSDRLRPQPTAPPTAPRQPPTVLVTEADEPAPPAARTGPVGRRHAIVIGVSEYADSRIPALRYAARDAKAVRDWLVSPRGGRYAPSDVTLLVDTEATYRNVREALFVWARRALPEDLLVVYLACHGSPACPDDESLYLLPHDADYAKIAATALPMWDVRTALARRSRARRALVFADVCHAEGVGEGFAVARRGVGGLCTSMVQRGLSQLPETAPGVAVVSSTLGTQLAQESERWGGGHGVFTHFLLEGLGGEADYDGDARVSMGELVPFLSEKVRRATRDAQTPQVSGRFDPNLTIAR